MIGHPFTSPQPPPGVPLQSWLRRRIATLEKMQADRITLTAQMKRDMNASIQRAQLEIDNLRNRLTIR